MRRKDGRNALRRCARKPEGAAIFEAAMVEADRERHVGLFGLDAEMIEERNEVGIVPLVVDDEADIDGLAPATRHIERACVAAEAALALIDHDFVMRLSGQADPAPRYRPR